MVAGRTPVSLKGTHTYGHFTLQETGRDAKINSYGTDYGRKPDVAPFINIEAEKHNRNILFSNSLSKFKSMPDLKLQLFTENISVKQ